MKCSLTIFIWETTQITQTISLNKCRQNKTFWINKIIKLIITLKVKLTNFKTPLLKILLFMIVILFMQMLKSMKLIHKPVVTKIRIIHLITQSKVIIVTLSLKPIIRKIKFIKIWTLKIKLQILTIILKTNYTRKHLETLKNSGLKLKIRTVK